MDEDNMNKDFFLTSAVDDDNASRKTVEYPADSRADLGEPWGPSPPCPQDYFKIMQFPGSFQGKTPIFSKF